MNSSSTFSTSHSTDSLLEDSSTEPFLQEKSGRVHKQNNLTRTLCSIYTLLVFTTLFSTISVTLLATAYDYKNLQRRTSVTAVPEQVLECGTSREEALKRGCVFDVMNYAWLPAPCYNKTISDQYWNELESDGITFYQDSRRLRKLDNVDILAAKHEYVYTSWKLHYLHCTYLIHRQLQAVTFGTPVDNLARNLTHAEHCLEEVRRPSDVDTVIYTGTAYLRCASGTGFIGSIYWNEPS